MLFKKLQRLINSVIGRFGYIISSGEVFPELSQAIMNGDREYNRAKPKEKPKEVIISFPLSENRPERMPKFHMVSDGRRMKTHIVNTNPNVKVEIK